MSMYKEAYYKLFNSITDVINIIETAEEVKDEELLDFIEEELMSAQCESEEVILAGEEVV